MASGGARGKKNKFEFWCYVVSEHFLQLNNWYFTLLIEVAKKDVYPVYCQWALLLNCKYTDIPWNKVLFDFLKRSFLFSHALETNPSTLSLDILDN